MILVDDLLIGLPLLVTAWRAVSLARSGAGVGVRSVLEVGGSEASILNVRGVASLTPSERAAIWRAANTLGIPVDDLATVIASESGWDSTALNPLPAAGLIQLTRGAKLPGFESAEAVRNVARMSVEDQIDQIVIPFYLRFGAKAQGASLGKLYMLNFLPALADATEDRVLAVRPEGFKGQPVGVGPNGETPDSPLLSSKSTLTLGNIYSQNWGFDASGKGYFTVGDIYAHIQKIADAARGERVAIDGTILHENVKTVGGCGDRLPKYSTEDDFAYKGDLFGYKTVGGAGCEDNCGGNWGRFKSSEELDVYAVKVVGGPGVPPGFERAREVFTEPDVVRWGETTNGSVRQVGGPVRATPEQIATVKRGIVEAVRTAEYDPARWTQIRVNEYDLVVMNEPLSVQGLRLPTSFEDAIEISKLLGALPITPVISDARFSQFERVYARPLNDATGALYNDPDQVVRYNAVYGPNTGKPVDGYWKELVLVPDLQPKGRGSMAQYGFKDTDSHMFEHGGPSNHNRAYKDYSDTPTYMSIWALKDGVQVNLLDELAAGGSLGGPLPEWLVQQLRPAGEVGV